MSNLLADPNNWQSYAQDTGQFVGPPSAYWDETTGSYYFNGSYDEISNLQMRLVAPVGIGDVISGEFEPITESAYGDVPSLFLVAADGVVLQSVTSALGVRVPFSFAASADMRMRVLEYDESYYVGTSRVYVDQPPPPPPPAEIECDEVGQVTRNNVSGYTRSRVFQGSLYASETRCLVTNFNGAIGSGRTIASCVWETDDISTMRMYSPSVGARDVKVMISAQYCGYARIRVSVTLDNGEVYSAWHRLRVMPAPYFNTPTWTDGPRRLEASAL